MGYIENVTSDLPNFSKAVISGWFKIPEATLNAVLALDDFPTGCDFDGWGNTYYPPLNKIIPLFTFGSLEVGTSESEADGETISPSYIGIDCTFDDPVLVCNLQMSNFATGDIDTDFQERPEAFFMGGGNSLSVPENERTEIVADQWYHFLISFDISSSCSNTRILDGGGPSTTDDFSSSSVFHWALNDVPRVGDSLYPSGNWTAYGTANANQIITQSLLHAIEGAEGSVATWSPVALETFGNPMGVPASSDFDSSVCNIYMGELQIFTDVSIDTSIEANRRAFVTSDGRPAHPSLSAALLEKSPEIYFQTAEDFITGNNRGTLAENFVSTGTILQYDVSPEF
jgi:hypothetical protein